MLAAHRRGGRTDFISFAKSWDRFTRAAGKCRPATEREVRILVAQLRASLEDTDGLELDRAIAEHRTLIAERIRRGAPGAADEQAAARAGRARRGSRRLPDEHDPAGEIRARRLRPRVRHASGARAAERREHVPVPS